MQKQAKMYQERNGEKNAERDGFEKTEILTWNCGIRTSPCAILHMRKFAYLTWQSSYLKKKFKNFDFFAGADSNPTNDPVVPLGTPGADQHTQELQPVITRDGE